MSSAFDEVLTRLKQDPGQGRKESAFNSGLMKLWRLDLIWSACFIAWASQDYQGVFSCLRTVRSELHEISTPDERKQAADYMNRLIYAFRSMTEEGAAPPTGLLSSFELFLRDIEGRSGAGMPAKDQIGGQTDA